MTKEERDALRKLCDAANLPSPVSFESGTRGQPYNLQCEQELNGMRVHPLVLLKTLSGWEPRREVSDLIVGAINALPQILDALDDADAENAALKRDAERWREVERLAVHDHTLADDLPGFTKSIDALIAERKRKDGAE